MQSATCWFDRFDAADPIDLPYPEGADAPVAEDVAGVVLYAYGDAAFVASSASA